MQAQSEHGCLSQTRRGSTDATPPPTPNRMLESRGLFPAAIIVLSEQTRACVSTCLSCLDVMRISLCACQMSQSASPTCKVALPAAASMFGTLQQTNLRNVNMLICGVTWGPWEQLSQEEFKNPYESIRGAPNTIKKMRPWHGILVRSVIVQDRNQPNQQKVNIRIHYDKPSTGTRQKPKWQNNKRTVAKPKQNKARRDDKIRPWQWHTATLQVWSIADGKSSKWPPKLHFICLCFVPCRPEKCFFSVLCWPLHTQNSPEPNRIIWALFKDLGIIPARFSEGPRGFSDLQNAQIWPACFVGAHEISV